MDTGFLWNQISNSAWRPLVNPSFTWWLIRVVQLCCNKWPTLCSGQSIFPGSIPPATVPFYTVFSLTWVSKSLPRHFSSWFPCTLSILWPVKMKFWVRILLQPSSTTHQWFLADCKMRPDSYSQIEGPSGLLLTYFKVPSWGLSFCSSLSALCCICLCLLTHVAPLKPKRGIPSSPYLPEDCFSSFRFTSGVLTSWITLFSPLAAICPMLCDHLFIFLCISFYELNFRSCVGQWREISLENQFKVSSTRVKAFLLHFLPWGNAECYLNLEMT